MSVSATVVEDLTTCSICLSTFTSPRSLPCLHSFCLNCIQDYCKANSKHPQDDVPCPVCRKEFQVPSSGIPGLPHSFFIQGLIDGRQITSRLSGQQSGTPCEVCMEDGATSNPAATKYCVDCDQKLCEPCSKPHIKWRGGGHEVKALGSELEQELLMSRGSFCDKHQDKRVELYCFDCKENICLTCSAVKHSDHKRGEISELVADFKSQINSHKVQAASRASQIRRQIKQVQDERNKLMTDVAKVGTEIKAAGEEAKRAIDNQVRERLNELESVKGKEEKSAKTAQDSLELELVAADSFHRYSSELVDKGRPSDITGAVAELNTRAGEILNNDVTSASYSAPYVTFTPADVTTLAQTDFVGQLRSHQYKVGELIGTLPEGPSVGGVTSLGDSIYLVRAKGGKDQVEEYDVITFTLRRCIRLPNASGFYDMTSCAHYLCLYISGLFAQCIHRVDVQGSATNVTQWPVNDKPSGLSVTDAHNLLVICHVVRKVKEFSPRGELIREITLPDDVTKPWHTMQLSNGRLVVCHGKVGDSVHRVVMTSADGQQIVHSHSGQKGSSTDQYNVPAHTAVDDNECVFVVDMNNRRVTLLSSTLQYMSHVVSREQFKWSPHRLCFDVVRRRLYVTENEYKDGKLTAGRVVVFSV